MQAQLRNGKSPDPNGNYIMLNGKRRELIHHPTDFAVKKDCGVVQQQVKDRPNLGFHQLTWDRCRVTVPGPDHQERNDVMDELRRQDVVHHIYQIEDTKEEIVITDQIFVTLPDDDPALLEEIREQYQLLLDPDGRWGNTYVFRVTDQSQANPLKIANAIMSRYSGVQATPKILVPIHRSSAAAAGVPELPALSLQQKLVDKQWHLSADLINPLDGTASKKASINAFEAWRLIKNFGTSDIVIAVIDDSFDLPLDHNLHPAFTGKFIVTDDFSNLVENNSNPSQGREEHGTRVASLATACNQMLGVAPGCKLMPIRIGASPMIDPDLLLRAFRLASQHADVVNFSFQCIPATFNYLLAHPAFRPGGEVATFIENGGRRKLGLVIVVASGDFDSPISLTQAENKNGVKYINPGSRNPGIVPAGQEVHTSFPEIPDVVVVGAMSSLMRKSGYSNWGKGLTVVAPSDNYHPIARATEVDEQFRKDFIAANGFPGRKILAAIRRGAAADINTTPAINEGLFNVNFGGTSAAAPLVTGVVALMLSAKQKLRAKTIIKVLKASADKDDQGLDITLDLPADPNMQGTFKGDFAPDTGLSPFFGAGKVNAVKAVTNALATPDDVP